ncbi:MAG TPA: hypothetical protein VK766_10285 [Cytophagaceae bacterium]|jgi:hypothetical protein|nr:hypothetical protein [Cytophagaceae bacterium]
MPTKIDLPKLESYSTALSEKLCNDYYQGSIAVISGTEILKFTGIDQLNLFIIKNLFDRWKEESYKLRSPYFDYENEDVKEALSLFLNKLSKYISIRKEFFKPLVKKAVSDTLAYIVDPYQFLKIELLGKPIISLTEIIEREKYIKVNKFLIQTLIKKLQLQNKTGFPENEVLLYFEEIYKNYEPSMEPPTRYIEAFSAILKITIEDLTQQKENHPANESLGKEEALTKIKTSEFVAFKKPLVELDKEKRAVSSINDSFARSKQLSLNDVMMKEEETNILTKHRKSKIHDLKQAVPINLRYIFINELFKGSTDDYNLALIQVERCEDHDSAKNILDQVYGKKYGWDPERTEVKEFLELIERRFY